MIKRVYLTYLVGDTTHQMILLGTDPSVQRWPDGSVLILFPESDGQVYVSTHRMFDNIIKTGSIALEKCPIAIITGPQE